MEKINEKQVAFIHSLVQTICGLLEAGMCLHDLSIVDEKLLATVLKQVNLDLKSARFLALVAEDFIEMHRGIIHQLGLEKAVILNAFGYVPNVGNYGQISLSEINLLSSTDLICKLSAESETPLHIPYLGPLLASFPAAYQNASGHSATRFR